MLSEGRRRAERGTSVVVACVETYGRPRTIEMLQGLELVAAAHDRVSRRDVRGDGRRRGDGCTTRRSRWSTSSRTRTSRERTARKRWEDVVDLLAERIEVITTVNIQHLESLNDVVADVTGVRQRETVPDWVVEMADQIELVDMSPHALQRRMLHGNVYPDPAKAELALQRYFTTENLTALRELALMRVANQVDETLLSRWSKGRTPETRERVLVCVSHPEFADDLVRRGARIAQRARGDLLVVHVRERNDPAATSVARRAGAARADLGGELHVIDDEDAGRGVLNFAYTQFVTQLVVGESRAVPRAGDAPRVPSSTS